MPDTASSCEKLGDRTRFTVPILPGETTTVSWKKLFKDHVAVSVSAPVLVQSESNEVTDAGAAPIRFNAVIEKIERLYMGRDSSDGEELDDVPDHDDDYDTDDSFIDDDELDAYFEVDEVKTKHDGFFVHRGQLERMVPSSSPIPQQTKRKRIETEKGVGESDPGLRTKSPIKMSRKGDVKTTKSLKNKSFHTSVHSSGTSTQKLGAEDSGLVKCTAKIGQVDVQPQPGKENITEHSPISCQDREMNGIHEPKELNVAARKHLIKSSLSHKRGALTLKPMLEEAIRDLEKMVAESRPATMNLQDADATTQAVRRRLFQEIKKQLTIVAKVAVDMHGEVSKDLLSRLMRILGHLINLRTLKRNLNTIIGSSVSVSQEKDKKFKQIKKEIVEMIKTCAPPLCKVAEPKSGSTEEFQGSSLEDKKGVKKVIYTIDPALEDKICDLYDIFVDGLDENVTPQVRDFYAKLAALWPEGGMDKHGVKGAICRSKERRRILHDRHKKLLTKKKLVATKMEGIAQRVATPNPAVQPPRVQEKVARPKKKSVATKVEGISQGVTIPNPSVQPHRVQKKVLTDSGAHVANSQNKVTSGAATSTFTSTIPLSMTLALPAPSASIENIKRPKHEKVDGHSRSSYVKIRAEDGTLVKKKIKRKREADTSEASHRPEKLSVHGEDRQGESRKQQQNPKDL